MGVSIVEIGWDGLATLRVDAFRVARVAVVGVVIDG